MDIPLAHLNTYFQSPSMTLREMAGHMRAAMDADMDCPIILDEDGEIMDGRHRIMRAIFEERETIKAVRFETNPSPCEIIKD